LEKQSIPETTTDKVAGSAKPPSAPPSGPPPNLQTAQARIHNIMNRKPEERGHPTTQADLAQAQQVVVDHVQKLEGQPGPRNEAQHKELTEAKNALARMEPPEEPSTSTHSSSGSQPAGTSASTNGDSPPTGIDSGAPPEGSRSSGGPSVTTATWSTGGEDPTRSSSATTNSPRPVDLATAGKALDAAKALREKGGRITLDEAHALDQAEKTVATATKANLENELRKNGQLNNEQARDLAHANATLARPAPRDRGPLPAIPDARRTIQDLSGKAAAGTLNADEAHGLAHAQRAIAQQRVNDLAAAEANGSLTAPQRRQLDRFRKIINASPYGTELPKGPPPGYNPHATNPAHREWHPPHGDKPVHPTADKFTPEALALSDNEINTTSDRLKTKGHAHDRHGPEVTEGQLSDRAMHKVDPITQTKEDGVWSGDDHNSAKHATQFTSERSMTQAVKAIEDCPEYRSKLAEAERLGRDRFNVEGVSLESALGPNYKEHVRGRTRVGSATNPTGNRPTNLTDGKLFTQYKKEPVTGKFYINTMFATPSLTHEPN